MYSSRRARFIPATGLFSPAVRHTGTRPAWRMTKIERRTARGFFFVSLPQLYRGKRASPPFRSRCLFLRSRGIWERRRAPRLLAELHLFITVGFQKLRDKCCLVSRLFQFKRKKRSLFQATDPLHAMYKHRPIPGRSHG